MIDSLFMSFNAMLTGFRLNINGVNKSMFIHLERVKKKKKNILSHRKHCVSKKMTQTQNAIYVKCVNTMYWLCERESKIYRYNELSLCVSVLRCICAK